MNNLFFLQVGGAGSSSYMPLVFMVGMFAVMYFFMIRPQQKKDKDKKAWVDELKKGDKVVTMSGLHGLVSQVSPENPIVIVEIATNTHVKMDKSAISLDMTKGAYPTA